MAPDFFVTCGAANPVVVAARRVDARCLDVAGLIAVLLVLPSAEPASTAACMNLPENFIAHIVNPKKGYINWK
jgi:hypothetical protein